MLAERERIITRDDVLKNKPVIGAGPCSVESEDQILRAADLLYDLGVNFLRGQCWKPRSSKHSFQGVGLIGLEWLRKAKERTGLIIATEIVDKEHLKETIGIVDIPWVGSRSMQNFELLKALAEDDRPVILKRGFAASIKEWMESAEYIGTDRVILCERGIRSPVDSTRFTMDICGSLVAKHDKKMPVLIDPSHSAGRRDFVPDLAYAAIASGVDGVIIETHEDPDNALSDAAQQILPETLRDVVTKIRLIHSILHGS